MTDMTETITNDDINFGLTDAAIERVATLIAEDARGGVFRIAVLGGGCSGFQYAFSIDERANPDDHILDFTDNNGAGVRVVIDNMSLELLGGSKLDFVQELIGNYFQVSNPNATASCGCGTSFAL